MRQDFRSGFCRGGAAAWEGSRPREGPRTHARAGSGHGGGRRRNLDHELYESCRLGDLASVKLLLDAGARVSPVAEDGDTPLHAAAAHGRLEVVKHLLSLPRINVEVDNRRGETPLFAACRFNRLAVVRALLKHGARAALTRYDDGICPIHAAASEGHTDVVRCLVREADVPVDLKDRWHRTPLTFACEARSSAAVELLVELGAETRRPEYLHIAVRRGDEEVMRYLLEQGVDINATADDKAASLLLTSSKGSSRTALQLACELGKEVGAAKLLVEAGAAVRDLPALLQLATSAGGPCGDLVAYLRSLEAPGGGGTDSAASAPASSSSAAPAVDLFGAAAAGRLAEVRSAVEQGRADVRAATKRTGATPLHAAAERGHAPVVRYLLSKGADAEASLKAKEPSTPLALAAEGGHRRWVVRALVSPGAGVEGPGGCLALRKAVEANQLEVLRYLLDHGAQVAGEAWEGSGSNSSALHLACELGRLAVVKYLVVGHRVDVGLRSPDSRTALMCAAASGKHEVVKFLLERAGADVMAKDKKGRTAMHHARNRGHTDIAELLGCAMELSIGRAAERSPPRPAPASSSSRKEAAPFHPPPPPPRSTTSSSASSSSSELPARHLSPPSSSRPPPSPPRPQRPVSGAARASHPPPSDPVMRRRPGGLEEQWEGGQPSSVPQQQQQQRRRHPQSQPQQPPAPQEPRMPAAAAAGGGASASRDEARPPPARHPLSPRDTSSREQQPPAPHAPAQDPRMRGEDRQGLPASSAAAAAWGGWSRSQQHPTHDSSNHSQYDHHHHQQQQGRGREWRPSEPPGHGRSWQDRASSPPPRPRHDRPPVAGAVRAGRSYDYDDDRGRPSTYYSDFYQEPPSPPSQQPGRGQQEQQHGGRRDYGPRSPPYEREPGPRAAGPHTEHPHQHRQQQQQQQQQREQWSAPAPSDHHPAASGPAGPSFQSQQQQQHGGHQAGHQKNIISSTPWAGFVQQAVEEETATVALVNLECPISCCLMTDPVIASDGNTYQRAAIAEWMLRCKAEKRPVTSPLTGVKISTVLMPNNLVKSLVLEHQRSRKQAQTPSHVNPGGMGSAGIELRKPGFDERQLKQGEEA